MMLTYNIQNEKLKKMLDDDDNENDIENLFKDDEEFMTLQGKLIQLEKEIKSSKIVNHFA